ncbi:MAG TPA: hypothetical protein VD861_19635, partial [Pyrinomonadaceae bacterium]|nr:hypothetical protein [Pyrinomonadaceae bacterium]
EGVTCRHERKLPDLLGVRSSAAVRVAYSRKMPPGAARRLSDGEQSEDVVGRSLLDAPQMAKQLNFLEQLGAPWRFGVDEPEKFTGQFGWDAAATQPGEVAPARWPFPTAPRHVPDVPRIFFVEARELNGALL